MNSIDQEKVGSRITSWKQLNSKVIMTQPSKAAQGLQKTIDGPGLPDLLEKIQDRLSNSVSDIEHFSMNKRHAIVIAHTVFTSNLVYIEPKTIGLYTMILISSWIRHAQEKYDLGEGGSLQQRQKKPRVGNKCLCDGEFQNNSFSKGT